MNSNPPAEALITYPGITAEVVPNPKNGTFAESQSAYEAVFNCGGMSVAPEDLRLSILRASLERKVRMGVRSLLYVSDEWLLASESFTNTRRLFDEMFPDNYASIPVRRSAKTYENGFWLRVVVSEIDENALTDGIGRFPDACAVASLPYADPSIGNLLQKLRASSGNPRSIQALDLLARNDRETPTEIAKEFVGYVGKVGSPKELDVLFETNSEKIFVFKPVGHRAGWTSTQTVTPEMRKEFLKKFSEFPAIAYEFLSPCLIETADGQCFPIQVRPYCVGDRILGASIKMPSTSVRECVDLATGELRIPKVGIAKLNNRLNSSSGRSISAFVDGSGRFVSGSRGMTETLSQEDFSGFRVIRWGIGLGNPENVRTLIESCAPLVRTVQTRTNALIFQP